MGKNEVYIKSKEEQEGFQWPDWFMLPYALCVEIGMLLLLLQFCERFHEVKALAKDGYSIGEHSRETYLTIVAGTLIVQLLILIGATILLLKVPDWVLLYVRFSLRMMKKSYKHLLPPVKAWRYSLKLNIPAWIFYSLLWEGRKLR